MAIQGPARPGRRTRGHVPGPEQEAMMVRLPDAAGQVRNVPVKVLRGIFAGIGQLLLAADRFRAEEAEHERAAETEQHDPLNSGSEREAAAADQPPDRTKFRSLDSTGNVRILAPGETSARRGQQPARQGRQSVQPRPAPAASRPRQPDQPPATRQSRQSMRAPAGSGAQPALPVQGYDGRSLPSLRSRLRGLDATQLRVLVEYEKSHAGRPDVVTMYERRIAKLESAGVKPASPGAS
jgi:hypothetical protein